MESNNSGTAIYILRGCRNEWYGKLLWPCYSISVWMACLHCSLGLCSSLRSCLRDCIGLVDRGLDNLLLFRIEVLGEIVVQGGLFLLKTCSPLATPDPVPVGVDTYEVGHA